MQIEDGMTLYHGTNICFQNICLKGHTSKLKDFGEGFYLTSFFSQAQNHAQKRAMKSNGSSDTAYVYKYEVKGFNRGKYSILELIRYDKAWLDFLTENRIHGCCKLGLDIVYDRMADNRWNVLDAKLKRYSRGEIGAADVLPLISKEANAEWDQYCFKTKKALALLVRVGCVAQKRDVEGVWRCETN